MKVLYFDCFAGASGDMIVGALVDLGVDRRRVRQAIASLSLPGLRVSFRAVSRHGIAATKFDVKATGRQPHRALPEIRRLVRRAELAPGARRLAESTFRRICEVEAAIHRMAVDEVHLHEVGALDSIADIVAAAVCLDALSADRVVVSEIPLGSGTVRSAHGVLPVPAPATLALLQGAPVRRGPVAAEMTTPTGAALLAGSATSWGAFPPMRPLRSGFGAGDRDHPEVPNLLRVVEGTLEPGGGEELVVLEVNLDDLNPQVYGHLRERLSAAGALDVYYVPVLMKKDRPGVQITVLARPDRREPLADLLFRETTTLGIRWYPAQRMELEREVVKVRTDHGVIPVKVGRLRGEIVQAAPEYEDCRDAALRRGVPLRTVQEAALRAFREAAGRAAPAIRRRKPTRKKKGKG